MQIKLVVVVIVVVVVVMSRVPYPSILDLVIE